jgi:hypothetical protein
MVKNEFLKIWYFFLKGTFSSIKPPGIDDDSDSTDELTTPINSLDDKTSKHAKAFKMVRIAIITILILLVITTVVILSRSRELTHSL